MKHLWDVDHLYYTNSTNYYSSNTFKYDDWDDFLAEMGDAPIDLNLIFRWDWIVGDELQLTYIQQRKGNYIVFLISVTPEDEPSVREFLKPHWEYLKRIWEPLS